jgi:hypothetical protein
MSRTISPTLALTLIGALAARLFALRNISQTQVRGQWPYFGGKRAAEVGTKLLKAYRIHRQQLGSQAATINKELTFLSNRFRIFRF